MVSRIQASVNDARSYPACLDACNKGVDWYDETLQDSDTAPGQALDPDYPQAGTQLIAANAVGPGDPPRGWP